MSTASSMPDFKPYPFEFRKRAARRTALDTVERIPVAIVGGGIAGLTAALGLAAIGVRSVVIEADDTVCFGSRAICISRRSLEIFARFGISDDVLAKGLPWVGGKSFYRNQEVLRFAMPHDEHQKLPPMVNIQQYYIEEFLSNAAERQADLIDVRWASRVQSLRPQEGSVSLSVTDAAGSYDIEADWVVACDGGRSTVREALGLQLQGTAYEGRYIIVDILMKSNLPTERLAWFDPPSNPGSTILMHKQPDDIWRIDYQLADDEDPNEAVKPENVLPRIKAHLDMMGETAQWHPLWISIYKANALTMERYRHGRVLFAGDAAHLVPIFGVRGANSSIDDVDNLVWKLALVLSGGAPENLLDTYSVERVAAARENLRSGMKSTEFMAPPSFAFHLMRQAVLELATDTPGVRPLINPRQTTAMDYVTSPLNSESSEEDEFSGGPRAGSVLQCVPVAHVASNGAQSEAFVPELVRPGQFLLLHFAGAAATAPDLSPAVETARELGLRLRVISVHRSTPSSGGVEYVLDATGDATSRYAQQAEALYLVRPDGHVAGRWRGCRLDAVERALRAMVGQLQEKASA